MLKDLVNPAACIKGTYQLGETSQSATKELGLSKVYKLNSNENPLGVSPLAVEAMKKAACEVNYYPDPTGVSLREKLAKRLHVEPDNIVITEGASVALTLLAEMFLNPGDEVLEHWPIYSGYQRRMIDTRQAVAVKVPVHENGQPDFEKMLEAITDKTRMVIICNPNNPTGVVCEAEPLFDFIRRVPDDIIVLVDETYIDFVEDETYPSAVQLIHDHENVVVVRTFSKIAGMAGARIGYAVACKEMIWYYNNMVNFFCASGTALAGAEAFLDDDEFRTRTRREMIKGRTYIMDELRAMGYEPYPSQTNFVACDMHVDPLKLTEQLRQKGILIRGNLGVPRMTVGDEEANHALIQALHEILQGDN